MAARVGAIGSRVAATTTGATGTGIGSTTQISAGEVARRRGVGPASAEPASRWASRRRRSSASAGRPVLAVGAAPRPAGSPCTLPSASAADVASGRVVAGTRGRRSSRRRSSRRPGRGRRRPRRSCTRSRAGRCPRPPPRRRSCGRRSASRPARRGGAGRRSRRRGRCCRRSPRATASAARSGSGTIVDRPAGQALADVVVGLADEPEVDAGPGERPERLAGRTTELEVDRAAEVAALEGARQRGSERAIGRRSRASPAAVTDPWPRNAVAMPASSGEAWRVADVAAGRRRDRRAVRPTAPQTRRR